MCASDVFAPLCGHLPRICVSFRTSTLSTAGLQFCVNLACLYVIRRNWSWADSQPASLQNPALGADNGNGNGDNTLFKATSDGADGAAGQENASKVPS